MTEAPAETPVPLKKTVPLASLGAPSAYTALYTPGYTIDLTVWGLNGAAALMGMTPEVFRRGLYFYGPTPADWPKGWHKQAHMNLAAAPKGLEAEGRRVTRENVLAWLRDQEFAGEEW